MYLTVLMSVMQINTYFYPNHDVFLQPNQVVMLPEPNKSCNHFIFTTFIKKVKMRRHDPQMSLNVAWYLCADITLQCTNKGRNGDC